MVDQNEIHRMALSEDVGERMAALEYLKYTFAFLNDKKQAWYDLIRLVSDTDSVVLMRAAEELGRAFAFAPDKKQAWCDLIWLTSHNDSVVRMFASDALGTAFAFAQDKKQAWDELHCLTFNSDRVVRSGTAYALGRAFKIVPDKKQAWRDLHQLTSDEEVSVREGAAYALANAFTLIQDRKQAWDDLIYLSSDTSSVSRWRAVGAISTAYSHIPKEHKKKAWCDLIKLMEDKNDDVRCRVAAILGAVYLNVPEVHKKEAWDNLIGLTLSKDYDVRQRAADTLGAVYSYIPEVHKKEAWDNLIGLTLSKDYDVRRLAADTLGAVYSYISEGHKKEAWNVLYGLTSDTDSDVRASAYHSLGKASIFKATYAENDIDLKKEMETAIGFFEKSSQQSTWSIPAKFCLPFYRSFYILTFKKEEMKAEVQDYISEARKALGSSKSKEKLLEVVENLGNALKEAQKVQDFNEMKSNLNAYRRYCERACELLDTTEEKAPYASRLIRKGLPIIDERIKEILGEIQEKAKALYKQVKNTEFKEIGQQVNNVGQELTKIRDPIGLEKCVNNMLTPLSAMCEKMPKREKGEACELLKKIKQEQYVEDRLPLINMLLSKFSSQMDQKIVYVKIEESKDVQVSIGNDNYQVHSSNSQHEKY